jgi:2,4-dienoyl-CoA reductase-like NADH-dependent reductase (Old Yellow Enzyme family)
MFQEFIVQLKPKVETVTKAVHEKEELFAQLWHTGRLSHPDLHGELPHAPQR